MKNLFYKILFGFTLGITLLIFSYVAVYYIAGQEIYNSSITKLTSITVFQNQILYMGLTGVILSLFIYLLQKYSDTPKVSPLKIIICFVLLSLFFIVTISILEHINIFDKILASIIKIILVALFTTYALFRGMQEFIDEFIINKKLNEKNN